MSAACEFSSGGRKMMSSAPVTTEFTAATSDADVIIDRRY
jgi:hypothetical protein